MTWWSTYWSTPRGRFWCFAGGAMLQAWGLNAVILWDNHRIANSLNSSSLLAAWDGHELEVARGLAIVNQHLLLGALWLFAGLLLIRRSGYLKEFGAWAQTQAP